MESSKSNLSKIILSSVAFGAASFGIGMFMNVGIGKAIATGAIGGTAATTGALISGRKKEEDNNITGSSVDEIQEKQIQELKAQEKELQESIAEKTTKKDEVEVGINSLQEEHQQLVEEISNLNSQKQKLESEYNEWNIKIQETEQKQQILDRDLLTLETSKQKLEQEQENLNQSLTSLQEQKQELKAKLITKQTELEQTISQVSQAQQQQEEIEQKHNHLKSQVEDLEKQREEINKSLTVDNIDNNVELIDRELEDLADNLSDSDLEQFDTETSYAVQLETPDENLDEFETEQTLELDAAAENNSESEADEDFEATAELEPVDSENPFNFESETAMPDSEDALGELEGLMGNLDESDLEGFNDEPSLELEPAAENSSQSESDEDFEATAELEPIDSENPFNFESETAMPDSEDALGELEGLMGNLEESDLAEFETEPTIELDAATENNSESEAETDWEAVGAESSLDFDLSSQQSTSEAEDSLDELEGLMGNLEEDDFEPIDSENPFNFESETAMPDSEDALGELEGLMGNLEASDLEGFNDEPTIELDAAAENNSESEADEDFEATAELEPVDSENPFNFESATAMPESEDNLGELEGLMGNLEESDLAEFETEPTIELDAATENNSESEAETDWEAVGAESSLDFDLSSQQSTSEAEDSLGELEGLMGNLEASDLEGFNDEPTIELDAAAENNSESEADEDFEATAELEPVDSENPFNFESETAMPDSEDNLGELEGLMGNLEESDLAEFETEPTIELDAATENNSESEAETDWEAVGAESSLDFDLSSQQSTSEAEDSLGELEGLMGNLEASDLEGFNDEPSLELDAAAENNSESEADEDFEATAELEPVDSENPFNFESETAMPDSEDALGELEGLMGNLEASDLAEFETEPTIELDAAAENNSESEADEDFEATAELEPVDSENPFNFESETAMPDSEDALGELEGLMGNLEASDLAEFETEPTIELDAAAENNSESEAETDWEAVGAESSLDFDLSSQQSTSEAEDSLGELEGLMGNLEASDLEGFNDEPSLELDAAAENNSQSEADEEFEATAELEPIDSENPFDFESETAMPDSEDNLGELEGLMGNLEASDFEPREAESSLSFESETAMPDAEDALDELEGLMGNLEESDFEPREAESSLSFESETETVELEELMTNIPNSPEFNESEILDEDLLGEQLEQLDGLISSIAEASTDLDELDNVLGHKKTANTED